MRVRTCARVVYVNMRTMQLPLRVFYNSFPVDCAVLSCMHERRRPPDTVESAATGETTLFNWHMHWDQKKDS